MTYELAKELKDAGFSQKVWAGTRFYIDETSNERVWGDEDPPKRLQGIVVPTLSELIEACGAGFLSLDRTFNPEPNNWAAYGNQINCRGATPEEAVARLWISLNKKA